MNNASPTDLLAHLLTRCARADESAFARLYELTSAKLFALALRILRRRDWAEDVLQESFINIWRHAGDYHADKGAPHTWLASIVRHRALDLLRRVGARGGADEETDVDLVEDNTPGPLAQAVQTQDAQALQRCLDGLQATQRESILLAYYHAYTHEQLARHLHAPLGTVKSWIRRGLALLKECLEP
ncbi:MAG TPA: sigma-70 family RNA polymerase sigma factor [Gammaproteobacteria bacterium]|nr:sigma-70 family RNA polymerase sigma factor [Gammaproteobacteria bacterium]